MYAVILAGGGGTRLHPLSRPEHPKPFLPLVTSETLVQGTVARLAGVTDDVTVVTDRRYERLVRTQLPGVPMLLEPLGRNTAAAIALAALAIDRPDDEVMLVLPADQTVENAAVFERVLRDAAAGLATGAFGIDDPTGHPRDPGRPPRDGVRLPDPGRGARGTGPWTPGAIPSAGSRRSPRRRRPRR